MEDALAVASDKDRIHLKNTEYNYARTLEKDGRLKEAIGHFENANTHRFDVPRMLINQPERLESYMNKTNDP